MQKIKFLLLALFFPLFLSAQDINLSVDGYAEIRSTIGFPAVLSFWDAIDARQEGLLQVHNNDVKLESYYRDIIFRTGDGTGFSSDKMIVKGNGNVGIGTLSPNARLHVYNGTGNYTGTNAADMIIEDNDYSYLSFQSGTQSGVLFSDDTAPGRAGLVFNHSNNYVTLYTGNTAGDLTIIDNGDVGIGTFSPDAQLEVDGYTMLGNMAPKVKMKKLTGTMGSTETGATRVATIPHGIADYTKILAMDITVYDNEAGIIIIDSDSAGYQFFKHIDATNIKIYNTTESQEILSDAVRILITYEE